MSASDRPEERSRSRAPAVSSQSGNQDKEKDAKKKTGSVPPLKSVMADGAPRRVSGRDKEQDAPSSASPGVPRPPHGPGIPPSPQRKRRETSKVPPAPIESVEEREAAERRRKEQEQQQRNQSQGKAPVREEIGGFSNAVPRVLGKAPKLSDLSHTSPGLPSDIPPVPGMPSAPRLPQPEEQAGEVPGMPPSFLKPKRTARMPHPEPRTREDEAQEEPPAAEPDPPREPAEHQTAQAAAPAPVEEQQPAQREPAETEEPEPEDQDGSTEFLPPLTTGSDSAPVVMRSDREESPVDEEPPARPTPAEPEALEEPAQEAPADQAEPAPEIKESSPTEPEPQEEPVPKRPEPLKFDFSKFAEKLNQPRQEEPAVQEEPQAQPAPEQPKAQPEPVIQPPADQPAPAQAQPAEPAAKSPEVVAADAWSEDKADEAAFHLTVPDRESPYLGLQRFKEKDADQYFGPDQLLADMLDALDDAGLIVLVGPPASGKSSFLRAGLAPNFEEIEGDAKSVIMSPDEDPYAALSAAVGRLDLRGDAAAVAREPAHYVFRRLEEQCLGEKEKLLILVDQFEQFGQCRSEADVPQNAAFVASLVELAERHDSRVKVVLSLRDDFYWKLGDYRKLAGAVGNNLFRLTDLDDKALRQVITEPLAESELDIEEDLIRHLISDVRDQPCGLPMLQHILDLLWLKAGNSKQLRLDDYLRFGGLEGALRRRLETLYSGFARDDQERLRRVFLRMVNLAAPSSSIRHSYPPIPRPLHLREMSDTHERKILDRLVKERLLLVATHSNVVELPVEVFLQAWPRFRRWLQEVQEVAALRNQLREDARTWNFRQERRGAEAVTDLLWRGPHLAWARDLRERGELDEMGEELAEVEQRFLDACLEANPPEARRAEDAAPREGGEDPLPAGLSREEINEALRELEMLRREREMPREEGETSRQDLEQAPPLPETETEAETEVEADADAQEAEWQEAPAEEGEPRRKLGGPAVSRKVKDEDLRQSIQLSELQHELIVRERSNKRLKLVLYVLIGLAALLFILMIQQCMRAAGADPMGFHSPDQPTPLMASARPFPQQARPPWAL